jgi:hypothetical protein
MKQYRSNDYSPMLVPKYQFDSDSQLTPQPSQEEAKKSGGTTKKSKERQESLQMLY